MALYFLVGVIIFVVTGWFLGKIARESFYEVTTAHTGQFVQEQIIVLENRLFIDRIFMCVLFAFAAYFVTEITLRPVKKSAALQKNFSAIVSHELRTPVTIMKNAAEVALRNESTLSHEKAIEIIRNNLEETNRLSDTIQFLLAFSSLETQHKTAEYQPVSLSDITKNMVSRMQELADERSIALTLTTQPSMVINGNTTALEGMIVNLIKNAIAHAPVDSTVTVSVLPHGNDIALSVTNTGEPINKADLPYIFEPFYRGSNTKRSPETYRGSGLGLSVVKSVVTFHNGSISVSSNSKNGTTFKVVLARSAHSLSPETSK
jgi:signal transduction histidine kinase